jgi:tetraacyldisaccharide 4'-kinase
VFPAGPLRVPLRPQLARTDVLIIVGAGTAADAVAAAVEARGKPVLRAHLRPDEASVGSLRGKRVLAFAGIGDPARFFGTLKANGIELVRSRAFADHHAFSKAEIEGLIAEASTEALTLVTTEKDLARLRSGGGLPDWAKQIVPFAVTLEFEDGAALRKFVTDQLFKARDKKFRTSSSRP